MPADQRRTQLGQKGPFGRTRGTDAIHWRLGLKIGPNLSINGPGRQNGRALSTAPVIFSIKPKPSAIISKQPPTTSVLSTRAIIAIWALIRFWRNRIAGSQKAKPLSPASSNNRLGPLKP